MSKIYPYNDHENPVGLNIHLTNGAIIKKTKKNLNTHIPRVIITIASCCMRSCLNYYKMFYKITHKCYEDVIIQKKSFDFQPLAITLSVLALPTGRLSLKQSTPPNSNKKATVETAAVPKLTNGESK